jgi:hypothetical protein
MPKKNEQKLNNDQRIAENSDEANGKETYQPQVFLI